MREKLKLLRISVRIILIMLVLAGIILICMTVDFHRSFALYLMKREKQKLLSELFGVYLTAFELLICCSVGLCICHFAWKNETLMEHIQLTTFWNGISFLLATCGLTHVWILNTGIQLLQTVVEESLFDGMDLYFSNPEWKLLWDEIQYQNECCGVNGYADWKSVSWITDEENKNETKSESGDIILIPYACCKRTALLCMQTYKPHLSNYARPNIDISGIHLNGCLSMLTDISEYYYSVIVTVMVCVTILHMLLIILQILSYYKVKNSYGVRSKSNEWPLIIVRHPRDVRCITCANDSFNDYVEDERLSECRFNSHSVTDCNETKTDIFLH